MRSLNHEWRKEKKGKVPMRFKLKSGEPFTFAGLWDATHPKYTASPAFIKMPTHVVMRFRSVVYSVN